MSKLTSFKATFKGFVSKEKNEFLENKSKYILKICCWICFVTLALSIQLLTMLETYHIVPVVLTVVFAFFVFLYCVLYGRFVFNTISIFYLFFLLYAFLVTLLGSKDFSTFYLTQMKLTVLMVVVFNFCVNFYKPKTFLHLLIILTIAISILFLVTSFQDIFALNKVPSENRIGNTFFGNVNYLGGALGSGVFFISIYLCYYKRHFVSLTLFSLLLVFLILRTGSRMPFITAIISIVFTLFFLFWRKHKIILLVLFGALVAVFVLIMVLPQFKSFSKRFLAIFEILTKGASSEASANQRLSMQFVAIQFWLKRFFFGYGSSGFAAISSFGTYSHSTLCEILCDYGIFGFFLFYFPLFFFLFRSKKGSLSRVCFLLFAFSQLIVMSLFGMLIYEKRFYIYIAIFASIFFEENCKADMYCCVERLKKFKFAISFKLLNFFDRIRNRCVEGDKYLSMSKKKVVFSEILVCFSLVLSFASLRAIGAFSNESKNETIAENISYIARKSSTNSANINVNPKFTGTKFSELDSIAVLCRNANLNKTSVDAYNFRLVYDSMYGQKISLDKLEGFNPTMLIHTSSGTHKNPKGENVFDWYELKTMFDGNHITSSQRYTTFVEIRESQAKILLERLGYEYSIKNCKDVLLADNYFLEGSFYSRETASPIKLKINNIILENQGMDERYYKTHGDYLMISPMSFPSYDGFSISFDFGGSFPETCNYLDYIETKFERGRYQYEINKNNIIDLGSTKAAIAIVDFWCAEGIENGINDILYYSILFLVLIIDVFFVYIICKKMPIITGFWLIASIILGFTISYLIFFVFSGLDVGFFQSGFSVFSSLFNTTLLLILLSLVMILKFPPNSNKVALYNQRKNFEINI